MDLDIFSNQTTPALIQKDTDPAKYDTIAAKLCDKRKSLEETLKKSELDPTAREEAALGLIQIKKDLGSFGVSEIDYQAYLASKEKEENQSSKETLQETPEKSESTTTLLVEPD